MATPRLPIPGQDQGNWGIILNEYLLVSHDQSGNLLPAQVAAAGSGVFADLQSGKVPASQLASGTPSASTFLRGDGLWTVPSGVAASAATTSATGLIQLAGDLGGSGTSATTPTIAATANVTGIINTVIAAHSSVSGAAQKSANLSDLASIATAKTNLGLNNVDNTHDADKPISTATQTALDAKASTSGLSVVATTGSYFDLSDTPAALTVGNTSGTVAAGDDARFSGSAAGTAGASLSATDASVTNSRIPSGGAGGDLSGTYPAPTVAKINGIAVSGTPTNGQLLTATSGTAASWQNAPASFADPTTTKGDLIVRGTTTTRQPVGTDGQVLTASAAAATGVVWSMPSMIDSSKLAITQNLADLADVSIARTNLGLGTAAVQPTTSFDAAGAATTAQSQAIAASLQKSANLSDLADVATARTNIGLGSVDNTHDIDKPISTATQTALNLKATTANLPVVASTGSYIDLIDKPTIPVAGVTSGTYAAGDDGRITGALQQSVVTAKGDLIAGTAVSAASHLSVGTNGQVLTADSSTATGLKWSSLAGGSISRLITSISSTTTAGALANTDYVYNATAPLTLTLPTAVGNTNSYTIKNSGTSAITVATTSSQTIDGSTTIGVDAHRAYVLYSDNANWFVT